MLFIHPLAPGPWPAAVPGNKDTDQPQQNDVSHDQPSPIIATSTAQASESVTPPPTRTEIPPRQQKQNVDRPTTTESSDAIVGELSKQTDLLKQFLVHAKDTSEQIRRNADTTERIEEVNREQLEGQRETNELLTVDRVIEVDLDCSDQEMRSESGVFNIPAPAHPSALPLDNIAVVSTCSIHHHQSDIDTTSSVMLSPPANTVSSVSVTTHSNTTVEQVDEQSYNGSNGSLDPMQNEDGDDGIVERGPQAIMQEPPVEPPPISPRKPQDSGPPTIPQVPAAEPTVMVSDQTNTSDEGVTTGCAHAVQTKEGPDVLNSELLLITTQVYNITTGPTQRCVGGCGDVM